MILIALLFFLNSCALFTSPAPQLDDSYISGKDLPPMTSAEIKEKLIKTETMAGGTYKISTWPLTAPLVMAQIREAQSSQNLSVSAAQKLEIDIRNKYLKDRTCFEVNFSIKEYDQLAQLQTWNVQLVQNLNDEVAVPLEWLKEDRAPVQTTFDTYHGKGKKWLNDGVACTNTFIKLGNEFTLNLSPKFVPWPFPEKLEISWRVSQHKIVDGKKIIVPTENKKKSKYRGW